MSESHTTEVRYVTILKVSSNKVSWIMNHMTLEVLVLKLQISRKISRPFVGLETRKQNWITHFHYHRLKIIFLLICRWMQRTMLSIFIRHTCNAVWESIYRFKYCMYASGWARNYGNKYATYEILHAEDIL